MLRRLLPLVLLTVPFSPMSADIIELKDGTIYLGTAVVENPTGITITSFGREETIPQSEILLLSKDLAALSSTEVEIRLPDRSVLKGKIRNYDEDIGLLLETYFGTITLPPRAIEVIQDPVRRTLFFGVPFQAGLTAGFQAPLADMADNFGGSFTLRANAEWNTGLLRGLYAGLEFGWLPLDYTTSTAVSYHLFDLTAYAMYRYLGTQLASGVLNRFIPFALLGGGVTYITVRDDRPAAPLEIRNEISPVLRVALGADARITSSLSVRAAGGLFAVIQSSLFATAYGELGLVFTP